MLDRREYRITQLGALQQITFRVLNKCTEIQIVVIDRGSDQLIGATLDERAEDLDIRQRHRATPGMDGGHIV